MNDNQNGIQSFNSLLHNTILESAARHMPIPRKTRGRYLPRKRFFLYTFEPLLYVSEYERGILERVFERERGGVPFFERMGAWQRGATWALQVPNGAFGPRFGCSDAEEAAAVDSAIQRSVLEAGQQGFRRDKELRTEREVVYFSQRTMEALRARARVPELLTAMLHFLEAAKKDRALIKGGGHETLWPLPQRRRPNGTYTRGPTWKPWEDSVLRRWFGRWPDGLHHKLTDKQWENILDRELKHRRTKKMVKQRLIVLNHELRLSLLIDGYLTRDGVREYMANALGERIKVPAFRPRLHGGYAPNDGNVVNQGTLGNPGNLASPAGNPNDGNDGN